EAVGKIEQISRACCRREFEQRFTDRHMAEDYIRFTSNCSAVHRLKRRHRTLKTVVAAYYRRSPRSLSATGRTRRGELIAHCSGRLPVVPEPRVALQSRIRNSSDPPEPVAARLSAPPSDIAPATRL